MAAPTNLLELAQQRVAAWTAEKTTAQTALAAAQAALTAGLAALETATEAFANQNDAITVLRAELSAIATPADAVPLLAELEDAIIAQRAASAAMLVQQGLVDTTRSRLDVARARLQRADAGITAAQAAVLVEGAARTRREAAKTAVTVPPLSTLPARATTLLGSATFNDAAARIDTDFPDALRDRSLARASGAVDAADRAATLRRDIAALSANYYATKGGAADKLAPLAATVAAAEDALVDHVERAVSRADAAEAVLARIGATANPALSAAEHAAIDDAVALPARTAAATAEDVRDTAADGLAIAQAKYDLEYVDVFAADGADGVTAALANAASDLAKAKVEVDDATDALSDANDDLSTGMRETLRAWRATVPDSAWADLGAFDAARRTLDELKQNPAALATALTNAEAALLAAAIAVDDEARRLRAYALALDESGGAAESAARLLERARLSALRGDA